MRRRGLFLCSSAYSFLSLSYIISSNRCDQISFFILCSWDSSYSSLLSCLYVDKVSHFVVEWTVSHVLPSCSSLMVLSLKCMCSSMFSWNRTPQNHDWGDDVSFLRVVSLMTFCNDFATQSSIAFSRGSRVDRQTRCPVLFSFSHESIVILLYISIYDGSMKPDLLSLLLPQHFLSSYVS